MSLKEENCHSEPVRTLAWESPKQEEIATTSLQTGFAMTANFYDIVLWPSDFLLPAPDATAVLHPGPEKTII